jgi:hypothetical protein
MWGSICVAVAAIAPIAASAVLKDGKTDQDQPKYDSASVIRISGAIEEIREVASPPTLKGVNITMKFEKRSIRVFLAPAEFLKTFQLNLTAGDEITVRGSKIRFGGADLLLAQELRKDNAILVLRDEAGNPYWEDEVFKAAVGRK